MHSDRQSRSGAEIQHTGKLQAVLNICQKMNAERDLVALLELIAREATRLMAADRASIFLLDREKHELWSHVALGSEPIRFDAGLGIAGATVQTGQTINVANAHQDSRFYSGIDERQGYQTQSLLAVPLRNYMGEISGAFEVLNKASGAFTTEDEELLKALAAQAAIAIETAQMVQELSQHRDRLLDENTQLRQEVEGRFATSNIIGTCEKIQRVVRLIEQIRDSAVDVLITGESGTGKELVARAIHYDSLRARHPFVTLNCAALPDTLVESELFGIEKGIATGVEQRIGKFERAHGGTLFLDEISDLSLPAQAKILRVLQEHMVERVGGRKAMPIDIRILAATNKELSREVEQGRFREDLYYRLNVIHIRTPPLRELQEDIPLLVHHFLTTYCQEMHKEPKRLTSEALACFLRYPWPGNVRELENEIKRLVVLTQAPTITAEDVSDAIRRHVNNRRPVSTESSLSLKETVEEVEKRLIREALQTCRNHQQQTAEMLGLSRQGLLKKMKRYGIKPG
jgi:Nif-specific regulatory protein